VNPTREITSRAGRNAASRCEARCSSVLKDFIRPEEIKDGAPRKCSPRISDNSRRRNDSGKSFGPADSRNARLLVGELVTRKTRWFDSGAPRDRDIAGKQA
jgi:hypothetical protein